MQQEPKCKCGQPCMSYESMTPNYDDGGSIDSFSPETVHLDQCKSCYGHDVEPTDELPF